MYVCMHMRDCEEAANSQNQFVCVCCWSWSNTLLYVVSVWSALVG